MNSVAVVYHGSCCLTWEPGSYWRVEAQGTLTPIPFGYDDEAKGTQFYTETKQNVSVCCKI